MIDPLDRWRAFGEKPDYAGLPSWGGVPWTEDADDLAGADAVIVGAPMDDLVSDRPGARFAPRAIRAASCPPGPELRTGVDALERLRVLDFGDAPCTPARPRESHAAIESLVGEVCRAGAVPVVLGGDHSISLPVVRALAAHHGEVGVVHFDAHTDTGTEVFGAELSHGTIFRTLVLEESIDPRRYVQVGLRGYWPGPDVFAWQREQGIRSILADDVLASGWAEVVEEVIARVQPGPVHITVDVDVLEPSEIGWATGTPEPGGLRTHELLRMVEEVAARTQVVGLDVVEALPSRVGTADGAALVADRVVRRALTGLAIARDGRS